VVGNHPLQLVSIGKNINRGKKGAEEQEWGGGGAKREGGKGIVIFYVSCRDTALSMCFGTSMPACPGTGLSCVSLLLFYSGDLDIGTPQAMGQAKK
jgi:hypothetical protein